MELQHTFTVPAPIEQAWSTLLDVEGIAPCFPGATLNAVDGDEFTGTVKVKLGPVSLQYAGKGRFVERDEAVHRVLLEASGSDRRGNGTAGASVTARLQPEGEGTTRVVVDTELKITGRAAQFGRGVVQDVGGKIIDQFAGCLASRMSASDAPVTETAGLETTATESTVPGTAVPEATVADASASAGEAAVTATVAPQPATTPVLDASASAGESVAAESRADAEPAHLDLAAVVFPALAKRYGPAVLAGLLAVFVVRLLRRRGR